MPGRFASMIFGLAALTTSVAVTSPAIAVPIELNANLAFSDPDRGTGGTVAGTLRGDRVGDILTLNSTGPLSTLSIQQGGTVDMPTFPRVPFTRASFDQLLDIEMFAESITPPPIVPEPWNFSITGDINLVSGATDLTFASQAPHEFFAAQSFSGDFVIRFVPKSGLSEFERILATAAATLRNDQLALAGLDDLTVDYRFSGAGISGCSSSGFPGCIGGLTAQSAVVGGGGLTLNIGNLRFFTNMVARADVDFLEQINNSFISFLFPDIDDFLVSLNTPFAFTYMSKFQELTSFDSVNGFTQQCSPIDATFDAGVTAMNCNYTFGLEFTGGLPVGSDPLPPGDELPVAGVSEPWTLSLFGIGLAALAAMRQRQNASHH